MVLKAQKNLTGTFLFKNSLWGTSDNPQTSLFTVLITSTITAFFNKVKTIMRIKPYNKEIYNHIQHSTALL